MFRNLCNICNCKLNNAHISNIIRNASSLVEKPQIIKDELNDLITLPDTTFKKSSVLEQCNEDVSFVAPYLKPTFNFASYVNKSVTLQELLKLGVNLHKLEKKTTVPPYILSLDFEKDIKNHVIFLHDIGLEISDVGRIITKNPYIFKQSLEDLEVRINYLGSKKFDKNMILRILTVNPFWLMFSTQRIDHRLGFFQKEFELTGSEVRHVTVKQPKLITYNIEHVKKNMFVINEEMGFTVEERKSMLLKKPKLFMREENSILKTFEYLHNIMDIPLETIVELPEILTCREFRLKQRHKFLEKLGKMQLNPKKTEYISILSIVEGNDIDFCSNVAKCPIETYNIFLKSL